MNFVFDLCRIRKSLVLAIGLGLNLILHKAGHKPNETHTKQIICQYSTFKPNALPNFHSIRPDDSLSLKI